MLFACVAWFVLGGAAWSARAQAPGLTPVKVTRIALTNIGPLSVSESLVRANIHVKEGEAYNRLAIDDDVRTLYATGYFLNIQVNEERTNDGISLQYVLQARPKIVDILYKGNTRFSNEKIAKKVKLTSKIGEPMDERKLFADAQEIKKLYEKSGYPKTGAKGVPEIDLRTGRATVTFEIDETPKVRVTDVQFEGAYSFKQKKLRAQLKTRRHWWLSWLTRGGVLKEDQLDDDKDKLTEFYRDAGYIDFELKEVKQIEQGSSKVILTFIVSEGRKYKVGAVDYKGVTLFPTNDITKKLKMGVGQTFTPKGLYQDTEAVQDTFGTKGYIDARVDPRRQPNVQTGTMDIRYDVIEGEQAKIEKVEIRGNTKTKDRVIRRELTVVPGEVFDMVKVKISKARLEGLDYFEKVDTTPERTELGPSKRDLIISVAEKNTGNVQLGAGFSSVDSLVGYVEVSQGNFDLFNWPNFTGGGQKARLKIQAGTERKDFEITLIEPWFLERKLELATDLFYRDLNYLSEDDTYTETDAGLRVGLRKQLYESRKATIEGRIGYTLQEIKIRLNPDLHGPITTVENHPFPQIVVKPANVSEEIAREAGDYLESKITAGLTLDTRDSYRFAFKGQKTEVRTELGGPFGGDVFFYKLELSHARYIKGFATGHLLELGARAGVAQAYGDTEFVPIFERYFLGGLDSLRGYEYRDIGPKDEFGEPLGGNSYWTATAEYSIPVIERVRMAVFYDIGMVYEKSWDFDFSRYADDWGFGLRLNLPIGPLRLDYGIPIHNSSGKAGAGKFQFSVGYQRPF